MLEDKLQEIIVIDADTKEVMAIISKENIVQKEGVDVVLNYSPNKKIVKDIDGKIYLNEDTEV